MENTSPQRSALALVLAVPDAEFVGPVDVPLVVAIVFDAETKASNQEH